MARTFITQHDGSSLLWTLHHADDALGIYASAQGIGTVYRVGNWTTITPKTGRLWWTELLKDGVSLPDLSDRHYATKDEALSACIRHYRADVVTRYLGPEVEVRPHNDVELYERVLARCVLNGTRGVWYPRVSATGVYAELSPALAAELAAQALAGRLSDELGSALFLAYADQALGQRLMLDVETDDVALVATSIYDAARRVT